MTSRRQFICEATGAAIGASIVIPSSALTKSILGARSTDYIPKGISWQPPYITEGLIAIWDGLASNKGDKWENLIPKSPVDDLAVPVTSGIVDVLDNGYRLTNASDVYGFTAVHRLSNLLGLTVEVVTSGMTATQPYAVSFGFKYPTSVFSRWGFRAGDLMAYMGNNGGYGGYQSVQNIVRKKSFGAVWNAIDGLATEVNNGTLGFSISGIAGDLKPPSTYYFYLMKYWDDPRYTNKYFCTGDIYCVRMYNRALSAEDIAFNYNVDRERFGI